MLILQPYLQHVANMLTLLRQLLALHNVIYVKNLSV